MPRDISAVGLAAIATQFAIEPVNIVQIQWVKNGPVYYYSDRRIPGDAGHATVEGQVLEISDIEAVLDLQKNGSSTSIKIKIDDANGAIKEIFNNNDIHSQPVVVYQWFTSLPLTEKFLLFEGGIASPIEWGEGDRVLSFDVLTKLEDREVGFSVEEGDFTNLPEELIGKSWPLIFGTVINIPAVKMDTLPTGTTRVPIGIPDHTMLLQLGYIDVRKFEMQLKANCLVFKGGDMMTDAEFTRDRATFEQGQAYLRQAEDLYKQVRRQIGPDQLRLSRIYADQVKYDIKTIPIINGNRFTQGIDIEISINGAHYIGHFEGNNFHVRSRRGPDEPKHKKPGGTAITEINFDVVIQDYQEAVDRAEADWVFGGAATSGTSDSPPTEVVVGGSSIGSSALGTTPTEANGPKEQRGEVCIPGRDYFVIRTGTDSVTNKQKEGKFFFANAGASVRVGGAYPVRYILSIVPGTTVISLSARHTGNAELKVIDPLPPSYYTISTMNLGGIVATIATFAQPISTIKDEDWEEEIFATLQSPIGPNVVDILIWLIQTYTEFTYDATSFAAVRVSVNPYPANFALLERKNVVNLLKDIAWQARCAIWLRNGVFFIKFLPDSPTIIDTLTEDDIVQQSMVLATTATEDLTTKMIAEWQNDYSLRKFKTVILKYNINKYGTHETRIPFFIYNNLDAVIKMATFWLIRLANIWKILKCKTVISKLKLETLDGIRVNFSRNYVADVAVNGIVERATFDSKDLSIDLDIWLPVRLGEMQPYIFAYPAAIDVNVLFPTDADIAGGFSGDGPPTAGDLQAKVNFIDQKVPSSSHRVKVSDTGDTPPTEVVVNPYVATPPPANNTVTAPQVAPTYDYRNRTYEIPISTSNQIPSKAFPGKVVSGSGDTYVVTGYPFGIEEDSVNLTEVKQLQIDAAETIPPDTWVVIIRVSFNKKIDSTTERTTTKYYMQVPVWIEDI